MSRQAYKLTRDTRAAIIPQLARWSGDIPTAEAALAEWPKPHPILINCWLWGRGKNTARPITQLRPHDPKHPVRYFYPDATRVTRICRTQRCCNPGHFLPTPWERYPDHPLSWECEATLETRSLQRMTLIDAYRLTAEVAPPHYALFAYRTLRQLNMPRPR